MDPEIPSIQGSEKITSVFGYWPSFHDAEVIEVMLHRNYLETGVPALTASVHVFEMTSEVSKSGHYVCRHHSIATLRFYDLSQLLLEDFNHQNALSGLALEEIASGFNVNFHSAYGMDSSFTCKAIEVVGFERGIPPGSVYAPEA